MVIMIVSAEKKDQRSPLLSRHSLTVSIAVTEQDVRQCLRLRHQVFAGEMGAQLESMKSGLDFDYFDGYARHLMVTDMKTGRVIATTRLLSSESVKLSGAFYSETEFDIQAILGLNAMLLEVGRTCVAESHRNGAALSLLWRGIVRVAVIDDVDYLMGCVSIPLDKSLSYAYSIMQYLKDQHYSSDELRVYPKHGLPESNETDTTDVILPTLLKGYLRLGAKICGEACYDQDFNVADVFILLDRENVVKRFHRHTTN
jgi:putative hemolysin